MGAWSPRDLLRYPLLLRLGEPSHMNWEDWFRWQGFRREAEGRRTVPDTNMALEAAMDGLGVALRARLTWWRAAAGYLVRLFDIPCPSNVAII
jgi:LysR family glycine cleavage system transcriptional activator